MGVSVELPGKLSRKNSIAVDTESLCCSVIFNAHLKKENFLVYPSCGFSNFLNSLSFNSLILQPPESIYHKLSLPIHFINYMYIYTSSNYMYIYPINYMYMYPFLITYTYTPLLTTRTSYIQYPIIEQQ